MNEEICRQGMGLQCRKIFKDVSNKIIFRKNYELIEVGECLPSFSAESFVFQVAIYKYKNLVYGAIIFPFVLYGCETWSLTLRKERKLRVFENRVLRRIYGPKRGEVTEERRKLHEQQLNYPYFSPIIIRVTKSRRMRWAGHVARMGRRGVYRVLVGKPEGKRPLGKPRRRWEDNNKIDLQAVWWVGMNWIKKSGSG